MSVATAKLERQSTRFALVRLTPARLVNDDLSLVSGAVWSMTWPEAFDDPRAVTFEDSNGGVNDGTEVAGTPTNPFEWNYNTTTRLLSVRVLVAPTSASSSVVVYHHVYFTGEKYRHFHLDPLDTGTDIKEWQPALLNYPNVKQSIKNIFEGVFTIAPTSVRIVDNRDEINFQQYLTDADSFSNKDCRVWQVIKTDTEEAIQLAYQGKIAAVRLDGRSITLDVRDDFNKLTEPALMGDSEEEAYFLNQSASYPVMHTVKDGMPVRMHFGTKSGHTDESFKSFNISLPVHMHSAVCTSYDQDLSGTVNRDWGICRIPAGQSLRMRSFGTLTAATVTGGILWVGTASGHTYEPGFSFKITETGEEYYVYVLYAAPTGSDNIIGIINTAVGGTSVHIGAIDTNSTYAHNNAPAIQILRAGGNGDHPHFFAYGRDFTFSTSTTSGGNTYVDITLIDDIEDELWNITGTALDSSTNPINPTVHDMRYKVQMVDETSHAEAMKNMVNAAGLQTQGSTFTQADSDLTADVAFSIPAIGQKDYKPYLEYIGELAKSTLGYLLVNDSLRIEYHVVTGPPTGSETRDGITIIDGTISLDINYKDIIYKFTTKNPELNNYFDNTSSTSHKQVKRNSKARHLHGIDTAIIFEHVLTRFDNLIDIHSELRGGRRAIYSWTTATEDVDTVIGDEITLDNDIVAGDSTQRDVKIIETVRSSGSVKVRADDLGDIT